MFRTAFSEGLRWGAVLGAIAVVLSIVGLMPSLSWIPEVPLLAAAVLLPTAVCGLAGSRAGLRSGRHLAGWLAGALAGGIGGVVGGACYVLFGKPPLNLLVGLCLGVIGGALAGAVGALISLGRAPGRRPSEGGRP
jgi:hypothetical protein